jgi:hypothetical protein
MSIDDQGPRKGSRDIVSDVLNEDDKRVLRYWRESLTPLDPRYRLKSLLTLAHQAMIDEAFRSRLISETQAVLGEFQPHLIDLPKGVKLAFFENTKDTLNVVLPPRAGEMAYRSKALREILRSRTSDAVTIASGDDWDMGNATDSGPAPGHADGGDPDSVDGPIFQ